MKKLILFISCFIFSFTIINIRQLKAQFPWPVTPFHQSQEITGTFCEFRDTGSADHFHNGTDIPKPDGSPVYPIKDGRVTSIGPSGSNAYVRVEDIAYVHIKPNPSLSIGDQVIASQTILGTILPGQGHLHFTNGYYNYEKNSMLESNGLTPLTDPWVPIIRYVQFYENNTTNQFRSNILSGRVDIVVKVEEQNGPPSSPLSRRNNGTYKIGYKILNADKSVVVYEPPNDGIRFQFNTKPSNKHVHRVFFDRQSSTSSHVYIVTNDITRDNYWDTSAFPFGNYVVMVFTEDTRQNTDTMYVAVQTTETDVIPPNLPVLKTIQNNEHPIALSWYPNLDSDLKGYRLYFSYDNIKWNPRLNENDLSETFTGIGFSSTPKRDIYFRLTAIDNAPLPNESIHSDVYGICNYPDKERILIVDGFDRFGNDGSWHEPSHHFVFIHGQAVAANHFNFDATSNDAIIDSSVNLNDYQAVIWILGDESAANETFSSVEQDLVKQYLENGSRLFISGSEIAWDLDQDSDAYSTTIDDELFLHDYLKADYVGNNSDILSVTGVEGTIFEDLYFEFGMTPYTEDSPDFIEPYEPNAIVNLKYNESMNAAIQYHGTFGNSNKLGKLVYLAFPFETITDQNNRNIVMGRILDFFFPSIAVDPDQTNRTQIPSKFALLQCYPNPFNPQTTIEYHVSVESRVVIKIYNVLGKQIRTLTDNIKMSGAYKINWDGVDNRGEQSASGIYLVQMIAEADGKEIFVDSKRLILIR